MLVAFNCFNTEQTQRIP